MLGSLAGATAPGLGLGLPTNMVLLHKPSCTFSLFPEPDGACPSPHLPTVAPENLPYIPCGTHGGAGASWFPRFSSQLSLLYHWHSWVPPLSHQCLPIHMHTQVRSSSWKVPANLPAVPSSYGSLWKLASSLPVRPVSPSPRVIQLPRKHHLRRKGDFHLVASIPLQP